MLFPNYLIVGDIPDIVAANFCKKHKLSNRLSGQLTAHIKQHISQIPTRKGIGREDVNSTIDNDGMPSLRKGASMSSSTDLSKRVQNNNNFGKELAEPKFKPSEIISVDTNIGYSAMEPALKPRNDDILRSPLLKPVSDLGSSPKSICGDEHLLEGSQDIEDCNFDSTPVTSDINQKPIFLKRGNVNIFQKKEIHIKSNNSESSLHSQGSHTPSSSDSSPALRHMKNPSNILNENEDENNDSDEDPAAIYERVRRSSLATMSTTSNISVAAGSSVANSRQLSVKRQERQYTQSNSPLSFGTPKDKHRTHRTFTCRPSSATININRQQLPLRHCSTIENGNAQTVLSGKVFEDIDTSNGECMQTVLDNYSKNESVTTTYDLARPMSNRRQQMTSEVSSAPNSARIGHAGERLFEWAAIVKRAKEERADEIRKTTEETEDKELTFRPKITPLAKHLQKKESSVFVSPVSSSAVPVWARDYGAVLKMKKEKLEKMKEEDEKKKSVECTFKPQISKKSREIVSAHQKQQQQQLQDHSLLYGDSSPFYQMSDMDFASDKFRAQQQQTVVESVINDYKSSSAPLSARGRSDTYITSSALFALSANSRPSSVSASNLNRNQLASDHCLNDRNVSHQFIDPYEAQNSSGGVNVSSISAAAAAALQQQNQKNEKSLNSDGIPHFELLYSDAIRRQQRQRINEEILPVGATFQPQISRFAKQQSIAKNPESLEEKSRRLCYDAIEKRERRIQAQKLEEQREILTFRPNVGRPPKPARPFIPSNSLIFDSELSSQQQPSTRVLKAEHDQLNPPSSSRNAHSIASHRPQTITQNPMSSMENPSDVFDALYAHALRREQALEKMRMKARQDDVELARHHVNNPSRVKSELLVDQAVKRLIHETFVCLDLDGDGLLGGGNCGVDGLPRVLQDGKVMARKKALEESFHLFSANNNGGKKDMKILNVAMKNIDLNGYGLISSSSVHSSIMHQEHFVMDDHDYDDAEGCLSDALTASESSSTLHVGCIGDPTPAIAIAPSKRSFMANGESFIDNSENEEDNDAEGDAEDDEIWTGVTIAQSLVNMVVPIFEFIRCTHKAVSCEQFEVAVRYQQKKSNIPLTDLLATHRIKKRRMDEELAAAAANEPSNGKLNISDKSRELASRNSRGKQQLFNDLYKESEAIRARREEGRRQKEIQEMKPCTFQPNTTHTKKTRIISATPGLIGRKDVWDGASLSKIQKHT